MPAYNSNMYDLSGATWRALLKGTVVIILVRTEAAIWITCLMAVTNNTDFNICVDDTVSTYEVYCFSNNTRVLKTNWLRLLKKGNNEEMNGTKKTYTEEKQGL